MPYRRVRWGRPGDLSQAAAGLKHAAAEQRTALLDDLMRCSARLCFFAHSQSDTVVQTDSPGLLSSIRSPYLTLTAHPPFRNQTAPLRQQHTEPGIRVKLRQDCRSLGLGFESLSVHRAAHKEAAFLPN